MISVGEAFSLDKAVEAAGRAASPPSPKLSDQEEVALDYLDATVESGILKDFDGSIFDFRIPADFTTQAAVEALKRRYQDGGWLVSSFLLTNDAGDVVGFQVVFAPGKSRNSIKWDNLKEIESIAIATERQVKWKRAVPEKPRVLLVSDVPGWAFDQNMRDLAEYLSASFDFGFFYTENFFRGERPKWADWDVVYEAYHRNPPMGVPMERALGALRSQWFRPEKPEPPTVEDVALVNKYRGFQVAAWRNFEEIRERCPNAVYLTNPVNTRRFAPREREERRSLVVEWNGNARHRSLDGRYIKHFYDIVVPATQRAGVQLVAAEFSTTEGPMRKRSSAEMPDFYASADVAVCASEYEAASNSVMEAMAAGLALVATDVGNHRELRDAQVRAYGDSGILLVEGSVEAFAGALKLLSQTPARAREMGAINRAEIQERWSWDVWQERYADFLRMAL